MPKHAELHKETEASSKSSASSVAGGELSQTEQETEQAPDKESIMKRLKAQGAVRVFPPMGTSMPSETAVEEEASEAEVEQEQEAVTESAGSVDAGSESGESESSEGGTTDKAFHDRVQKMTDAANNPKWYDLPQHIDNARHGKWDLSQSRERSGGRARDTNLEEDVRTNKIENEMSPGTFNIKQKAKNAISDVTSNPGQTAAGMVPVVGKALKQKLAEKHDVRERDLLKGVAATQSDESVRESAASQGAAISTKINNDRFKAGVGTVTGIVGDLVPGAGKIGSAVSAVAGIAADRVNKKELNQVKSTRARERARKDMGESEFGEYEGVDEVIALEKMRKGLEAAGNGDEDSGAPSNVSGEQVKRLKAHTRGELPHAKLYAKRAKEVEKDSEIERQKGMEPKPKDEGAGLLSKFKNLFKRSS